MKRCSLGRFCYLAFGKVGEHQKISCLFVKGFAGFCQLYPLASAQKQGNLQFFFQHFHLVAERWLCHMEFPGSTADRPGIYNSTKVF